MVDVRGDDAVMQADTEAGGAGPRLLLDDDLFVQEVAA
jgi:hypothetical protein